MKMKTFSFRFIVGLVTFIIGVACVSVWLVHRYSQPQTIKPEVVEEPKIPNDTLIMLERTRCYGTCPSYTLTISADGSVVFNAKAYWVTENKVHRQKESGVILSKVSREQLLQLISEFEKASYFSLRDSYKEENECPGGIATDSPTIYTSFQINGRRKAISHYYGCVGEGSVFSRYPPELVKLEKRIDEIVNTEQWMK